MKGDSLENHHPHPKFHAQKKANLKRARHRLNAISLQSTPKTCHSPPHKATSPQTASPKEIALRQSLSAASEA